MCATFCRWAVSNDTGPQPTAGRMDRSHELIRSDQSTEVGRSGRGGACTRAGSLNEPRQATYARNVEKKGETRGQIRGRRPSVGSKTVWALSVVECVHITQLKPLLVLSPLRLVRDFMPTGLAVHEWNHGGIAWFGGFSRNRKRMFGYRHVLVLPATCFCVEQSVSPDVGWLWPGKLSCLGA